MLTVQGRGQTKEKTKVASRLLGSREDQPIHGAILCLVPAIKIKVYRNSIAKTLLIIFGLQNKL
jgi:hypothetical protein